MVVGWVATSWVMVAMVVVGLAVVVMVEVVMVMVVAGCTVSNGQYIGLQAAVAAGHSPLIACNVL